MKIGNNHARQASKCVSTTINGNRYHFYPASWEVDKNKLRYVAKKAESGKVEIPEVEEHYETRIVYVTKNNKLTSKEV